MTALLVGASLATASMLAGCGQKGPLTLAAPAAAASAPAPAASADGATR